MKIKKQYLYFTVCLIGIMGMAGLGYFNANGYYSLNKGAVVKGNVEVEMLEVFQYIGGTPNPNKYSVYGIFEIRNNSKENIQQFIDPILTTKHNEYRDEFISLLNENKELDALEAVGYRNLNWQAEIPAGSNKRFICGFSPNRNEVLEQESNIGFSINGRKYKFNNYENIAITNDLTTLGLNEDEKEIIKSTLLIEKYQQAIDKKATYFSNITKNTSDSTLRMNVDELKQIIDSLDNVKVPNKLAQYESQKEAAVTLLYAYQVNLLVAINNRSDMQVLSPAVTQANQSYANGTSYLNLYLSNVKGQQ